MQYQNGIMHLSKAFLANLKIKINLLLQNEKETFFTPKKKIFFEKVFGFFFK